MKKIFKMLMSIPWWGWVLGFVFFALQYGMYRLGNHLSDILGTKANAWCPKISFIDDLVPLIAVFIVIYIFSYVFWLCGPIAVSLTKRANFINYIIGLSAAYLIGFLIFTFLPTYMDRAEEGILNIAQNGGFFEKILVGLYEKDGGTIAFNLFPSYHCLISVYCYLGVRKQPEIAKGFRIYSLIMAILICLSTQFTKQHYILDLIGGVAVAIVCYIVLEKLNPGEKIMSRKSH